MRLICRVKFVLVITFAVIFSSVSYAKETIFGMGFGYQYSSSAYSPSDVGSELYFPMNTDNFLFEPALAIHRTESDKFGTDGLNESEQYSLGLFKKSKFYQKLMLYFGVRFGIYKFSRTRNDSAGTYITPTIGFEHYFSRNISLGIETGLRLSKNKMVTIKDNTEISTLTNIILRMHF